MSKFALAGPQDLHTRADDGAETAGLAWVAGLQENEGAGGLTPAVIGPH